MRFLDLFAGIGGFSLGLKRAGMECVGQVENDEFCLKVLEKHWPEVKRVRDIRDVTGREFGAVELICGGFPCQPFSCAGQRRGKEDDRCLWPEMLRVIKIYHPNWILGENVAGIIGVELDKVYADLEEARYEFPRDLDGNPVCFCIPACAVDAPHRRDRVWIIAHSNNNRFGKSVQSFGEFGGEVTSDTGSNGKIRVMAHSSSNGQQGECLSIQSGGSQQSNFITDGTGEIIPHSYCGESEQRYETARESFSFFRSGYRWLPEPDMGRVAHGVSNRVDRLRALGNAVVPQVVEMIGRAILEYE